MAISVDRVYRKVLAILNKESRGFLTPDEFSKIGSQAQLDLLDKAFHDYTRAITKESFGRGGQGYADIPKKIQDRIDPFYANASVTLTSGVGTLPTFYNIINVSADSRLTNIERIEKSKLRIKTKLKQIIKNERDQFRKAKNQFRDDQQEFVVRKNSTQTNKPLQKESSNRYSKQNKKTRDCGGSAMLWINTDA